MERANNKQLEVIALSGPLGSGKTTTLNELIKRVSFEESYAVVVNDVGEGNIDEARIRNHPANRSDMILPLTAGCIGCSDATQFREALRRVDEAGASALFIEPTGIAPGNEIADVVRSSGYPLSVLTLANTQTTERDMKWQVLPSQISVADIVGLTHIQKTDNEVEVMSRALDLLPPLADDVAVELIRPGDTDYNRLLAKLRGVDKELCRGRETIRLVEQMNGQHCDHYHDHHHHHDHGVTAKSYRLQPGVDVAQVESLLLPYAMDDASPLLRAKGVTGKGEEFDLVGTEWSVMSRHAVGKAGKMMNVIFGGKIPADFLLNVQSMTQSIDRQVIEGDKKSIVKSIDTLPTEDRIARIYERTSQYPSPISQTHGELIPDCEADEGYEIAFWGKKNGYDIPRNVKCAALRRYIDFRLRGLELLQKKPEMIMHYDQKAAYWKRRYGATLGYNYYHLRGYLDNEQAQSIRTMQPAALLVDGFLDLDSLTFDEGRAEEKPEFIASVLRTAVAEGDISVEALDQAARHGKMLAAKNKTFSARWCAAFPDNAL